ncbi:MAG: SHD1 domain-containing protein [Pirellulales bacterium]
MNVIYPKLLRYFIVVLALAGAIQALRSQAASIESLPGEEFRKWKDTSGKFEIEAKFLSVRDGKVNLERRDGKQVSVPVDKLSPVDQGYIEGRMIAGDSSGGADNPFKEVGPGDSSMNKPSSSGSDNKSSSSGSGNEPAEPTGALREWKVVWDDCNDTTIQVGQWSPKIPEQPNDFKLKPISLPPKADFFEGLAETTFNRIAKRAVLTFHVGRPGQPVKTRMVMVDLEQGKVLANAVGDGKWTAMTVSDDGQKVVVRNEDEKLRGQLGTVKLTAKSIIPIDIWKPYETLTDEKARTVRFASFLNTGKLLTLNHTGNVVIWDFESRSPLRRFHYHGEATPALTIDRKYLGFAGGDLLGMINLEDENEMPSVKAAPGMNFWIDSCFSPSCKRYAASNLNKLTVWDVATGETLFDGAIPGIGTGGKLTFPDEDFVMVNGDKLIEVNSGIKVWQYQGYSQWAEGKMIMVANEDKGGKMMEVKIPHTKALDTLKLAKSQSDLFIVKKGASVDIDLSGVPQQYQVNVEQSLKKNLETKGLRYRQGSPVILKPTITGPSREAVSYAFFGSMAVNKYTSGLGIFYNGINVWNGGIGSNVPGMISAKSREDAQKQLEEAGQSPYLGFFNTVALPDFLQKPSATGGNNQAQSQMLGTSRFSVTGLMD